MSTTHRQGGRTNGMDAHWGRWLLLLLNSFDSLFVVVQGGSTLPTKRVDQTDTTHTHKRSHLSPSPSLTRSIHSKSGVSHCTRERVFMPTTTTTATTTMVMGHGDGPPHGQ